MVTQKSQFAERQLLPAKSLALASRHILYVDEARAADRLVRQRHVRHPRRAPRRQLPQGILDELRPQTEQFQECAHFLELLEGALPCGHRLVALVVGHEGHAKRGSGATDRTVNLYRSLA